MTDADWSRMTSADWEYGDEPVSPTAPQRIRTSSPPARSRYSSNYPAHLRRRSKGKLAVIVVALLIVAVIAGIALKDAAMAMMHHYTQSGTVELTIDGKSYICQASGTAGMSNCYRAVTP